VDVAGEDGAKDAGGRGNDAVGAGGRGTIGGAAPAVEVPAPAGGGGERAGGV
jgi:hypothetical protein